MNEVYLAAWTGGLEMPEYRVFATREEVVTWVADSVLPDFGKEPGDDIDILLISLSPLRIAPLGLSPEEIAIEASGWKEKASDV